MQYFEKVGDNKIKCLLCGHHCSIHKDSVGICGINKNNKNTLECLVYGYPNAINIDPVEKKPLFHFLPKTMTFSLGTVGCNFKCPFCQNWQLSQSHEINKTRYFSAEDIVENAIEYGCKSISFTYNEPTIFYPYAKDIALLAKQKGLKTIFVTNGFMSDEVVKDMQGVIDAFNIDIKSFDQKYYKKVLKGGLEQILKNAKRLKQNGHWIEITTLIVPNHNDLDEQLNAIAKFITDDLGVDTPWHISAFHPDYKELDTPPTSIEMMKKAKSIGEKNGLKYIYLGNTTDENTTFCPKCKCKLITRNGYNIKISNFKNGVCTSCNTQLEGVFS